LWYLQQTFFERSRVRPLISVRQVPRRHSSRAGFVLGALCLFSAARLAAAPTINTQPSSASFIMGAKASFTVVATAGVGPSLTYQWQYFANSSWSNLGDGGIITGSATATLKIDGPPYDYSGTQVRCLITDTGDSSTATSNTATMTLTAPAPFLILAHPFGKPSFQGDASASYTVVTSGTVTDYQWQLSTDGGTTWNILAESAPYSGTTTSTLTIADPYTNLGGVTGAGTPNKYRCQVSNSDSSYTINSKGAALTIFATPGSPPTITTLVNGSAANSIATNDSSPITVQVSGVNSGGIIRIDRFADLNGDGVIEPGEPLVQSMVVRDGTSIFTYGGTIDPNIPSDGDNTANGTVNAVYYLKNTAELGQAAGKYLFRVVSTTGAFAPVTSSTFTYTQPAQSTTVSGTVTDGATPTPNPVPYARVALLDSNSNFIGAVVADVNGAFSINAAPGKYMVFPLASGYVLNQTNAQQVDTTSGSVASVPVVLAPADYMNVVQLQDQNNGSALRGVQLFLQSKNGYIGLADSDAGGVVAAGAAVDVQWGYDPSSASLSSLGYVRPSNNNSNGKGTPLASTNSTVTFQAANAMIYGTLKDNAFNPLANVDMNGGDQNNNYSVDAITDAGGNYYIPVYGTGGSWYVNVDNTNPLFGATLSAPQGQSVGTVSGGHFYTLNFVAPAVTAHIAGTVTNATTGNSAVTDATLNLNSVVGQNVNFANSVTTGHTDGSFSFGLSAGSWQIQLDSNYASNHNLVAPLMSYTINDGDNLTGQAYAVQSGTGTFSGNVLDFSGATVANANISASALIGGVTYVANVQADGTGHFSFPVINGTWTINAFANNGLFYPQHQAVISGSASQPFSPSVFTTNPGTRSITAGSGTSFNVNTNTSGVSGTTYQWQVSTDGGTTYNAVSASAPYSGTTTNNLNISNAPVSLNGYKYRLSATFTYNSVQYTRTSNFGTLTVTGSPPSISVQPNPQTISAMSGTNFNVAATGSPSTFTYQWKYSTDNGVTFNNLTDGGNFNGSTTSNLNVNNANTTLSGYQFECVVSNTIAPNAVSNAVTLTVNPVGQTVNFPGPGDQTYVTHTIPLSASATSGGSIAYSIQSGPATVSGNQLTLTGIGTVVIRASQAGSSFYASAFTDATINVSQATASVFLNSLIATYDGTPKSIAPTTNPGSLSFGVTYNGSSTPPTNAGPYSVVVTVTDPNYLGSASGTFTINKANATVNLGSLTATYDGSAKSIAPTTTPASLGTSVTYNGSSTAPTNAGTYGVIATVTDSNYQGSASGTFTVNKATATVNLGSLSAIYDGSPKSASATTTPSSLGVNFTYTPPGDSTLPINAGTYGVVGTISDPNYQGTASGSLVIAQASQTISFTGPADQPFSTTPITLSATGGGSGNPVTFSWISGPATLSGTNNITLTLIGAGTVTVRASQAGNANYSAAPDVDQSFNVSANLASWQASKFTADEILNHPELSGLNAVYGQDGLPNLVKYALGLEPKQNITTGLPVVATSGANWTYTYMRPTAITDVTYTVEYSTDLVSWTPLGAGTQLSSNSGTDTWQATYPLASATNIYFRLKITQP